MSDSPRWWTTATHREYPERFRKRVEALLLCANASETQDGLGKLPRELLLLIIEHMAKARAAPRKTYYRYPLHFGGFTPASAAPPRRGDAGGVLLNGRLGGGGRAVPADAGRPAGSAGRGWGRAQRAASWPR